MTTTAARTRDELAGEAAPITLKVNGEPACLAPRSTLGDLLRSHELDPRLVVIEHNRVILRDRGGYDAVALTDGDLIEIVHFVGGG
ncbi:MAG: sulfur carrier protein ThiS [Gemmatimonadaceae bacterium]